MSKSTKWPETMWSVSFRQSRTTNIWSTFWEGLNGMLGSEIILTKITLTQTFIQSSTLQLSELDTLKSSLPTRLWTTAEQFWKPTVLDKFLKIQTSFQTKPFPKSSTVFSELTQKKEDLNWLMTWETFWPTLISEAWRSTCFRRTFKEEEITEFARTPKPEPKWDWATLPSSTFSTHPLPQSPVLAVAQPRCKHGTEQLTTSTCGSESSANDQSQVQIWETWEESWLQPSSERSETRTSYGTRMWWPPIRLFWLRFVVQDWVMSLRETQTWRLLRRDRLLRLRDQLFIGGDS